MPLSLPHKSSVVICSIARTPIAKFCGSLASLKGSQLGSIAIQGALAKLPPDIPVKEAFLGNVLSAGMGQAPARQAILGAGLPQSTICTTVNKVCASGMKAVMLATQALQVSTSGDALGYALIAGGFESMSNVPHYLPSSRNGVTLGHTQLRDGIIWDGLWDVYSDQHMGMCAEKCARDYNITRQEQDAYAVESYRRASAAAAAAIDMAEDGVPTNSDIVPVAVVQRKDRPADVVVIDEDEELASQSLKLDKIQSLKPAFDRSERGTVTAANSSSLNDGAAALVLMREQDAINFNIEPLARIRGYGDAACEPVDFTTAPSLAIPVALHNAGGMQLTDVEYHEINEAFAVVALANMKLLNNLSHDQVNVFGGAVAFGHPIGMSGTRIIGSLYQVLKQKDATIGCASICNGGGEASAIVIERLR